MFTINNIIYYICIKNTKIHQITLLFVFCNIVAIYKHTGFTFIYIYIYIYIYVIYIYIYVFICYIFIPFPAAFT